MYACLFVSTAVKLKAMYVCNYCTLLQSSLDTTSPISVSEFLEEYEEEFFDVTVAKYSLRKMQRKGVISQEIADIIKQESESEATEALYEHLRKHANVDTMKEYCCIITAAEGYPKMQAFGRKMSTMLQLGGWWKLFVWVGCIV